MIDPAMLGVGRERGYFTLGVGHPHLAIIAAANDVLAVGGAGEDRSAMDRDASRFGRRLDEEQCLLTEDEHRIAVEEVRSDDRRARGHGMRTVNNGNGLGAGIGH
jgi:hypothetical protein